MPLKLHRTIPAAALTVAFALAAAPGAAEAKGKTADQIVDEMLELDPITYGGAEARVLMVLVNKRQQQRKRKVVMLSRTDGEVRRTYIRFLAPNDIAGTSFLGIDNDGDRVQHLFMPALGKTRRISSKQRNSRFVGTDYSYADLDNRDIDDSRKKRLADDKVGGQDCYVVEVAPSDSDSDYGRIRLWIAKNSYLPLVMKFFDGRGKEMKRFVVKDAKKVDGRWVIQESKMVDLRRKHSTVMRLASIKFKSDIPLEQFSVRALERE
jgi:hypothetical protein